MGDSKIAWTDKTWPVVNGCQYTSPGCFRCYAARDAAGRLKNNPRYAGLALIEVIGQPARFTGEVRLNREVLDQPTRWRTPQRIFVASQADLFHPKVPDGFIMDVWRVMASCPHHTFQLLTKRPDRMAAWVEKWCDTVADELDGPVLGQLPPLPRGPDETRAVYQSGRARLFADMLEGWGPVPEGAAYPPYDWQEGMRWLPDLLPNLRQGTSIENDQWCRRRNHQLQAVRALFRFISAEPLLGPLPSLDLEGIHQVIVGGESGRDAGVRRMDPGWVRAIRDQCRDGVPCETCRRPGPLGGAGGADLCPICMGTGRRPVAFFFKQAGTVLAREWGMKGAGHVLEQMPAEFAIQESSPEDVP